MMLTIKQWQQPGRDTRVYNNFDAFKCHGCKERMTSVSLMSLICCADASTSVQYCSDCWDTVEWTCPDCNKTPEDCDVVGCERCGQWTHLGCQINIEDKKDYVCASCKESARAHTLVPKMKVECYDLAKNLATTKKHFFTIQEQMHSLTQAHEKAVCKLRSSLKETNQQLKVRTKQFREMCVQKESCCQAHEKTLSDLNYTKNTFKLATECYKTEIDGQSLELDRANTKVASLAADVMQQADDLQVAQSNLAQQEGMAATQQEGMAATWNILKSQYSDEISTLKGELKMSKDELADVHGHYASEISTLTTALGNNQRSEQQEIIALRENNRRVLSANCSLAKSNTKLKLALQDERAKNADTMSIFKKTNKRARFIYEQQEEQITALKKARVTIRWNGSMPKKLQGRLLKQRYRNAWIELNCQWQDYFGDIRVRARYEKGPVVYNTLDGFMCAIRKRDNKEQ